MEQTTIVFVVALKVTGCDTTPTPLMDLARVLFWYCSLHLSFHCENKSLSRTSWLELVSGQEPSYCADKDLNIILLLEIRPRFFVFEKKLFWAGQKLWQWPHFCAIDCMIILWIHSERTLHHIYSHHSDVFQTIVRSFWCSYISKNWFK